MFRKQKTSIYADNDMLKQYYANEYPMYKKEIQREAEREVKSYFERARF